jgi:hypothetical protein
MVTQAGLAELHLELLGIVVEQLLQNTDLIVDNVVYDDASGYNATTGQFTAPVAGLYHFDAGMRGSNANIGRTNFCFISEFARIF